MGKASRAQVFRRAHETEEEREARKNRPKTGLAPKGTGLVSRTKHPGSKKNFDHEARAALTASGTLPTKGKTYRQVTRARRKLGRKARYQRLGG